MEKYTCKQCNIEFIRYIEQELCDDCIAKQLPYKNMDPRESYSEHGIRCSKDCYCSKTGRIAKKGLFPVAQNISYSHSIDQDMPKFQMTAAIVREEEWSRFINILKRCRIKDNDYFHGILKKWQIVEMFERATLKSWSYDFKSDNDIYTIVISLPKGYEKSSFFKRETWGKKEIKAMLFRAFTYEWSKVNQLCSGLIVKYVFEDKN